MNGAGHAPGAATRPTISVVVPTHRRPDYLATALDSILAQTVQPFEIVVSEDGNDPETKVVVGERVAAGAPIVHNRNERKLGQLGNRRRAFELARGDYVAMLDDDDFWLERFLETTSTTLAAHPECTFCATDHYVVDDVGRVQPEASRAASVRFGRASMKTGVYDDVLLRHLRSKAFSLHSSLFRRSVLEKLGFFPEYAAFAPDFALFLELGASGASVCYVAEPLGCYRVHMNQQTGRRVEMAESLVNSLTHFARRHALPPTEHRMLSALYRSSVVELAIALAHAGERKRGLEALHRFANMGWGTVPARRMLVFSALLAGVPHFCGRLR